MRTCSDRRAASGLKPRLVCTAVAACFATPVALALPVGPQVVVGSAAFSQQSGALTVTNTPGTVINWRGFSIGASEATRFIQQGPASSVLNRVLGPESSAILGALQSNGRVWLVNPNGILFGPSARIDVQGLVASTLGISNADFLAGRLNFEAGAMAGGIRNEGTIQTRTGGNVYLVARDIENSGIVRSPQGEVMLAAGHKVSLVEAGNPDLQMVVSAPADRAVNLGKILVEGGRASLFGATLAQRGVVSASRAGTDAAGRIVFRATKEVTLAEGSTTSADGATGGTITVQSTEGTNLISGEVTARGTEGKGGTIQLLGERVGLVDHAGVDASGQTGGGTVLVGGDYQGRNAAIQNASATYVSPDASIAADAKQNGDGGRVIVWSDDATRMYGTISARGGAQGGNGGFVEASGKAWLDFRGAVDTQAPSGSTGTLLLDPGDISISNASDSNISYGGGIFYGGGASSVLSWATLTGQLGSTNVTVTTSAGYGGAGDISVNAGTVYNSTHDLTLHADDDILVHGNSITNNGSGAISLNAGSTVSIQNATVKTAGAMNVTGSFLDMSSATLDSGGMQTINVNGIDLAAPGASGASIKSAGGQNITVGADGISMQGGTVAGRSVQILQSGALAVQTINVNYGGSIGVFGGSSGTNNFARIDAAGDQVITGPYSISLHGGTGGGGVGVGNFAQIRSAGNQSISVGYGGLTLQGGGGPQTGNFASVYQSGTGGTGQTITVYGGGSLLLNGGNSAMTNVGSAAGSFAFVRADGGSQQINFPSGGSIEVHGGSGGSGNSAGIYAPNGSQTITGSPSPDIMLFGGANGIAGEGNYAEIFAATGAQDISAGAMNFYGGGVTTIDGWAGIFGPNQTITANGSVTLNGGNGPTGSGARIGSQSGKATDLYLAVYGGSLTLNGDNAGAALGTHRSATDSNNVTLYVDGDITLNPGGGGTRIGYSSAAAETVPGSISVTAGGDVTLGGNATAHGAIRSKGEVSVTAGAITLQPHATIDAGSGVTGNLTLTADFMSLAGSTITSIGDATLRPRTNFRNIDLGDVVTEEFTLTVDDLNSVHVPAPYTLIIGDSSSGSVRTGAPLLNTAGGALANVTNLKIETGGGINIDHPITLSPSAGVLQLIANSNVEQTAPITSKALYAEGSSVYLELPTNSVGTIAGTSFSGTQTFAFANSAAIKVGTVAGHSGIYAFGTDVRLVTYGGGITQDANAPIYADSLLAVAPQGPVTLLASNNVNTLAGVSYGGFQFHNDCCGSVTIGTVAEMSGVSNSGGGGVMIDGAEGISVARPISAGTGDVKLIAGEGSGLNILSSGPISGGNVRIIADSLTMQPTEGPLITATSTNGVVRIGPSTDGYPIYLGGGCDSCLSLSGSDLSFLIQADRLAIGNNLSGAEPTSGNITVNDTINRPGGLVALETLGRIGGSGGTIIAHDLVLSAVGGIGCGEGCGGNLQTQVTNLQATNTNNGIEIDNLGDLTLKNLGAGYAIRNTNGAVVISASYGGEQLGNITVAAEVKAGKRFALYADGNVFINANISGTGLGGSNTSELIADASHSGTGGVIQNASSRIVVTDGGELEIGVVCAPGGGCGSGDGGSTQNIVLGSVNAGTGLVKIRTEDGGVRGAPGAAGPNVRAGDLVIRSEQGIDLNTAVSRIELYNGRISNAGNISIRNTGALTVDDIYLGRGVQNDGGSVSLSASSPLTISSESSGVSATGNIALSALNDGPLVINAPVTSQFGWIALLGGTIDINADLDAFGWSDPNVFAIQGIATSGDINILPLARLFASVYGGGIGMQSLHGVVNFSTESLLTSPGVTMIVDQNPTSPVDQAAIDAAAAAAAAAEKAAAEATAANAAAEAAAKAAAEAAAKAAADAAAAKAAADAAAKGAQDAASKAAAEAAAKAAADAAAKAAAAQAAADAAAQAARDAAAAQLEADATARAERDALAATQAAAQASQPKVVLTSATTSDGTTLSSTKDDDAKKKQQDTQTGTTQQGGTSNEKPKNYCNP